jgi:predicted molibdopterin-dependent oxidoreductase YjgC
MAERVVLRVDGAALEVAAGTNLAAALVGAGVLAFRRSVGGQPRGPLCAMGICFECRVTVDGRPHVLACGTLCRAGMEVRTAAGADPRA